MIKDDTIRYERYFNGYSRDSIVTSFSTAKSITSALIGIAIEENYIADVKDPLIKYLPEVKGQGFDSMTIRDLLLMLTHRGEVARIYLPPDANCLLSVANHCLRSTSYVNLIVIDKQPQLQWLTMEEAVEHCAQGASVWKWAGNDDPGQEPDVVLACAGDIVTMEVVAAAQILRERLPQLRTRVVNVVDLMKLIRPKDHPHGMGEMQFAELFTQSVDVVFAFHGFPGAIHQVLHGRPDADRFHVRGYIEEGTTTTPFDMTALNRVTRYHLVIDAITNARRIPAGAGQLLAWCEEKLREHDRYVVEHLEDLPEIRNWQLPTR